MTHVTTSLPLGVVSTFTGRTYSVKKYLGGHVWTYPCHTPVSPTLTSLVRQTLYSSPPSAGPVPTDRTGTEVGLVRDDQEPVPLGWMTEYRPRRGGGASKALKLHLLRVVTRDLTEDDPGRRGGAVLRKAETPRR